MAEVSDTQVRELAQKILARPEYDLAHPTREQTWLKSFFERLFNLFDRLTGLHATAPVVYWLILFALFAIFALLVTHIVWTISVALRAPEPVEPSAARPDLQDPAKDAAALASSGSYLEAAHALMIASFRTLGERSVIELRPDRANRWIRGALRQSHLDRELATNLESLIANTERHWFGDRENNPAIYSQWQTAFEELSHKITE